MNQPRKRNSQILNDLEINKDPLESNRTRTSMLLAMRIISAIKGKGLNNMKFAELMDKKPSVITRWLSGTHNFTSDTLSDIQYRLGVNLFNFDHEFSQSVISQSSGNVSINVFKEMTDYSKLTREGVSVEHRLSGIQVIETVYEDLN